jgi:hypothetical protein
MLAKMLVKPLTAKQRANTYKDKEQSLGVVTSVNRL